MNDPDVAVSDPADTISDEEGSLFDQEVREMGELLDEFETIKEMPNPEEKFYPINRAARRNAEKRNRALKKRKPNG